MRVSRDYHEVKKVKMYFGLCHRRWRDKLQVATIVAEVGNLFQLLKWYLQLVFWKVYLTEQCLRNFSWNVAATPVEWNNAQFNAAFKERSILRVYGPKEFAFSRLHHSV